MEFITEDDTKNIKLDIFDTTLPQEKNLFNNGYRPIYDAGYKTFIKTY